MFEWSVYLLRYKVKLKRLKEIDESHWRRFRIQWADFRNTNGASVQPEDLITLSTDVQKEEVKPMSFKEAKAAMGSKIKKDVS